MSPTVFTTLLGLCFAIHEVDMGGLKASELIIERVTGPPPAKSKYLSADSGAKVRRVGRKSSPGLNMLLNVTRVLPKPTMIIVRLYRRQDNAYKSQLIEYKTNFCDYLAREHRPIFTTIKDVLKLPKYCPVEPGVFKVENWQISKQMPPMLPISEGFKLQAIVSFEKQDNIDLNVFLRIARK